MCFGVIRPGWVVEAGVGAPTEAGHCFFDTSGGGHSPGNNSWEGVQSVTEQGDRIGMLLDLDQGSMTIWKNDNKLGVMQAEGLTGPLCWVAGLAKDHSARIVESAPVPASPMAEGPAAATVSESK